MSADSLLRTSPPPLSVSSTSSSICGDARTKERTAIIFDWDDTLFPSAFLASWDLKLDSHDDDVVIHRPDLLKLEQLVLELLNKATELGTVHVITNAESGWVELSSQKYLPGVAKVLPSVTLLSARSKFEPLHPSDPSQWKVEAFKQTLANTFDWMDDDTSSGPLHVISFGDSFHERHALHVSTAGMRNAHVKSVKFVERPTLDVLIREVELLKGVLDYIVTHMGDLDLMLSQNLLFGGNPSDTILDETKMCDVTVGFPTLLPNNDDSMELLVEDSF